MRMFDVQGIELDAPRHKIFELLRLPENLPRWAQAFVSAGNGRARLETPGGAVDIVLEVSADAPAGTVDWRLEFPDGGVGIAQSRVTQTTRGTCIYSFVLHAPPVSLEQIEGALEVQRATLRSELATLRLSRVRPDALAFAEQPSSYQEARELIRRSEQARWALQVHRARTREMSDVDFARDIARNFGSRQD